MDQFLNKSIDDNISFLQRLAVRKQESEKELRKSDGSVAQIFLGLSDLYKTMMNGLIDNIKCYRKLKRDND